VKLKAVYVLFKKACSAWADDNAPSMGAALAFYTVFSLAPVLIVAISVPVLAFGQKAAKDDSHGNSKVWWEKRAQGPCKRLSRARIGPRWAFLPVPSASGLYS